MRKIMSFLVAMGMIFALGMTPAYAEEAIIDLRGTLPEGNAPRGGQPPMDGEAPPELPDGIELPEGMEPPTGMGGMTPPAGEAPRGGMGGEPMGDMPVMLDTDSLMTAIAALDTDDSDTGVTALLEAYIDALEAERAALGDGVVMGATGDPSAMQAAQAATAEARAALEAALAILGIDVNEYALALEEGIAPPEGMGGFPGQNTNG